MDDAEHHGRLRDVTMERSTGGHKLHQRTRWLCWRAWHGRDDVKQPREQRMQSLRSEESERAGLHRRILLVLPLHPMSVGANGVYLIT